jgi:hypothetical protein
VLPLFALFSTLGLIYIVFSRSRRNAPANIWILMLIFFLLWTMGEVVQKSSGDIDEVLSWTRLCIIFGDLFPAIFLVFTLVYPTPNELMLRYRVPLVILIIGPKVFSTMISLAFGTFEATEEWDAKESQFGYYSILTLLRYQVHEIGTGDSFFFLGLGHTLLLLSLGAFVLLWNLWRSENESVKRATRIILIGFATYMIIGASTGFIIPLIEGSSALPELFSLGNLLMNFIVAYGLLQGQVLLFSPTTETEEKPEYPVTLETGEFYLCSTEQGIATFTDLVNHGYEGLYVGAVKPNLDITKFKRTPIVILTEAGKGLRQYGNLQYVPADELKTFKTSIFTFIASANRGVIFLDNMDLILEKNWAHPKEFVEMGTQMMMAPQINALWMFGTPLKEESDIEKLRSVMDYPVVKKAIILDKLNSIITKMDVDQATIEDQLKRLARVEPIFGYMRFSSQADLVFTEDISDFAGILATEPANPIRLFIQQFQSSLSSESYKQVLDELHADGISRFEFLLRTGDSYLIEETFQDRGRTYEVYLDFIEKGFHGICITRTEPTKLRQRYLLPPDMDIFWLTQDRKEDHDIKPAPEYLMVHIKSYIEGKGREPGIVLLDGLEYLITFQGDQFDSYLKVLRRISDLVSQSKVMLLIPYDPEAIPAERVALFRRSGIEVITRDMLA